VRRIPTATIPEKFLDLPTAKKAFANLATIMKDGSRVWFDYKGGKI
jgi:hypothetical protein